MLLRLALETAAHHAPADDDRLRGLAIAKVEDYRAFLARIFGFEVVVERTVERLLRHEHTWIRERMRSQLLRDDLRGLGLTEAELTAIPLAAALHVPSLAHGLGWMFVLERHTLVSGQLRRHVSRVLGPHVGAATRYLSARGERPGTSFKQFGEALGDIASTIAPSLIVVGANEAFRTQRQWYAGTQRAVADNRATLASAR